MNGIDLECLPLKMVKFGTLIHQSEEGKGREKGQQLKKRRKVCMHMLIWNVDFRWFPSLLHHNSRYHIVARYRVLCVLVFFAEMNTSSSSIDLSGFALAAILYLAG